MTPEEMIAVIQAHKDGAQIQFQNRDGNVYDWRTTDNPVFNFATYNYRVTPPKKPDVVKLVKLKLSDEAEVILTKTSVDRNLRLFFDADSGELVKVDLLFYVGDAGAK
jgi:hypothetical protein